MSLVKEKKIGSNSAESTKLAFLSADFIGGQCFVQDLMWSVKLKS